MLATPRGPCRLRVTPLIAAQLLCALFLCVVSVSSIRAEIAVVVDQDLAAIETLVDAVRRAAGSEPVRLHDLRQMSRTDAIQRGRFLSRIAAADLVVPLGGTASSLVADELEDARTFFVGGSLLPGSYLRLPNIAGILPYNPDEVARVIAGIRPGLRTLGVASTPGYEPVVAEVREAADRAGLRVVETSIGTRRDAGPAIRRLASTCDVIWLLGDPIVGSGAGLQLVIQSALSARKPVVGTIRRQVEAGALYCMEPDPETLSKQADRLLREIVSSGYRLPARRITTCSDGGTVVYHGPLAERLGVRFRAGTRLERIR